MSGGAASSTDEAGAHDVLFYVSGTIGSRGTTNRGTSVYGGDVVVSGTLSVNRGQAGAGSVVTVTTDGKVGIGTDDPSYKLEVGGNMSVGEYIYHRLDANTFIQFADDAIGITVGGEQLITVTEAGQDIVKIGDGGDVDFQVRTNGDDNTLFVQGSSDRVGIGTNSPSTVLHVKESAPTVTIQRESNANDSTLQFMGQAGATATVLHMGATNDLVMTTFDGSDQEEILRLGSHYAEDVRQVIMLSGSAMHAGAMHPKESTDINFFASGSIGSRNTAVRGTAVFGGDVVVSGTMDLRGGYRVQTRSGIRGDTVAMVDEDEVVICFTNTGASGGVTVTLPNINSVGSGKVVRILDGGNDAANNNITINVGDATNDRIYVGGLVQTLTLNSNGQFIELVSFVDAGLTPDNGWFRYS